MGFVYAELELINGDDLVLVRRNMLGENEVKRMKVKAMVDTGTIMLCINESIQQQLQLPVVERKKMRLANGSIREYEVVAPVELRFKNRRTSCQAIVVPNDSQPLLRATALEEMDLLIHPQRNELIVNPDHPYFAQVKIGECAPIEQ